MWRTLFKHKLQYFFGVAGIFFILFSMYTIQDITKLQITFISPIKRPPLIAGIIFIVISITWGIPSYLADTLYSTDIHRVSRTNLGVLINMGHAKVEVVFGRLEEVAGKLNDHLFALPANNLFDDECINDKRSSLGAFVNHVFPNRVHEICKMVKNELRSIEYKLIKSSTTSDGRYELGTTLYFDRPLGENVKMAFVAVTTVSEEEGIQCEASNILTAIKGVHQIMSNKRLDSVIMPLLGSGHGGVPPEVSLLCMLLEIGECLKKPSGHHIKEVKIVVYQESEGSKPEVSRRQVRRLLALAIQYCS